MDWTKYLIILIIFSFLGWIYEFLLTGKECSAMLTHLTSYCIPLLLMYGLAVTGLVYIYENFSNIALWKKIVIATIFVNIMECALGQSSYLINGKNNWNYDHFGMTMCSGYVSLKVALWWGILIAILFKTLEYMYAS